MSFIPRQIDAKNLSPHTFQTINGNVNDIFRILNQLETEIQNQKQITNAINTTRVSQQLFTGNISASGINGIGTPNTHAMFTPDSTHIGDSHITEHLLSVGSSVLVEDFTGVTDTNCALRRTISGGTNFGAAMSVKRGTLETVLETNIIGNLTAIGGLDHHTRLMSNEPIALYTNSNDPVLLGTNTKARINIDSTAGHAANTGTQHSIRILGNDTENVNPELSFVDVAFNNRESGFYNVNQNFIGFIDNVAGTSRINFLSVHADGFLKLPTLAGGSDDEFIKVNHTTGQLSVAFPTAANVGAVPAFSIAQDTVLKAGPSNTIIASTLTYGVDGSDCVLSLTSPNIHNASLRATSPNLADVFSNNGAWNSTGYRVLLSQTSTSYSGTTAGLSNNNLSSIGSNTDNALLIETDNNVPIVFAPYLTEQARLNSSGLTLASLVNAAAGYVKSSTAGLISRQTGVPMTDLTASGLSTGFVWSATGAATMGWAAPGGGSSPNWLSSVIDFYDPTSALPGALVLDAEQTNYAGSYISMRYNGSILWNRNSFVPLVTANIGKITLRLYKSGSPTGNIWVKICSDSACTNELSTSALVNVSTLSTDAVNGADQDFIFSGGAQLTSGVTYYLKFDGDYTISTVNNATIMLKYPGSSTFGYYNGSSLVTPYATMDAYYKEYYGNPPVAGSRYISSATANGWTVNRIYQYNGATWDETIPVANDTVNDKANGLNYMYSGSAWATTTWVKSGSIKTAGLTMSTAKLLGCSSVSAGAIEEISIGSSMSLSAGVLNSGITINTTIGKIPLITATNTAGDSPLQVSNGKIGFNQAPTYDFDMSGELHAAVGLLYLNNYQATGYAGAILPTQTSSYWYFFSGTSGSYPYIAFASATVGGWILEAGVHVMLSSTGSVFRVYNGNGVSSAFEVLNGGGVTIPTNGLTITTLAGTGNRLLYATAAGLLAPSVYLTETGNALTMHVTSGTGAISLSNDLVTGTFGLQLDVNYSYLWSYANKPLAIGTYNTLRMTIYANGGINFSAIPRATSNAGLSSGDVWCDTTGGLNILKIV